MSLTTFGVVGAAGRMGQMLVREIAATPGCKLVAASERPGHPRLGEDAGSIAGVGALGAGLGDDPAALFRTAEAVIDFTSPKATVAHAALAAKHKRVLIVGTTGMEKAEEASLAKAAKTARIVRAPNMSVGVNLLLLLTEKVAATLGVDYDIEIVEMHHRHKVDAPSGTALGLGQAAARGRRAPLEKLRIPAREGITGPRAPGGIGFATLRGGDVVGDHSVVFATEGERIELTHKASSRQVFAKGAVRAALWAKGRKAGLYTMADVLGLG